MPIGKRAKKKLDDWLHENVNMPLHENGYTDTGAAISALISAGGELLIPDDLADAAMAAIPGARLIRNGGKGVKALTKSSKPKKPIEKLDYGAMKKAEGDKAKKLREAHDKTAETLVYGKSGAVTRNKPNSLSYKLQKL